LVTACPWCVQNLRDCQGDCESIRVLDLVEVLDSSLRSSCISPGEKRRPKR
jgi:hypothetical protein